TAGAAPAVAGHALRPGTRLRGGHLGYRGPVLRRRLAGLDRPHHGARGRHHAPGVGGGRRVLAGALLAGRGGVSPPEPVDARLYWRASGLVPAAGVAARASP